MFDGIEELRIYKFNYRKCTETLIEQGVDLDEAVYEAERSGWYVVPKSIVYCPKCYDNDK